MQFRIVSHSPEGFFGSSERLDPQDAASLFLSLTRACFAEQLDKMLISEVSLREWVDQEDPPKYIIYAGLTDGWKISLVPATNQDQVPSYN